MKKLFLKLKMNKGFAVLFTVLVSAIILAIALGITSISYQEIVLSSSAKEGNIAFYAADSGAECALYWDSKGAFDQPPQTTSIVCNGSNGIINPSLNPFSMNLSNNSCAIVSVGKNVVIDPVSGALGTKIESLGYNVSCPEVINISNNNPNPRLVERAIRVTYGGPTSPLSPPPF